MGIEDACVGEPCELPSSVYPKDLVHEILAGLEALCVGLDLEGLLLLLVLLLLLGVHLCCWRSPCLPSSPPLVAPPPKRVWPHTFSSKAHVTNHEILRPRLLVFSLTEKDVLG